MSKKSSPIPIYYNRCADDLRAAGPAAMLVAAYLQYSSNSIGFFLLKFEAVSRAVGLASDEIKAVLLVLEKIGFLRFDPGTQIVWIIDHAVETLGYLRPTNKAAISEATAEFAAIPEACLMRADFLWSYAVMLRLQLPSAAYPSDVNLDSEDQNRPDFPPKLARV